MTRLIGDAPFRREAACEPEEGGRRRTRLAVDALRLKGARWACEVDYEPTFLLGARKAAERRGRWTRRMTP